MGRGVKKKLTRLENEGSSDIDIPTITCWFDTLIGAQQRANDERGGLANAIKRPELDAHAVAERGRGRGKERGVV